MAKDQFDNKNITIDTSDIEIGAVEIKDHDGTDRAEVTASNALKVDGSAVTQPVSGAVTVKDHDGTDQAAVNASNELQVRDDDANDDLDTIAGAVSGTEMQVDIVSDGAGLATDAKLDDIITALGSTVDTEEQETAPTDASKNNPSYAITYDGSNQPTLIAVTIGGTTYNRTLTWTDGNLTAMTAWSAA